MYPDVPMTRDWELGIKNAHYLLVARGLALGSSVSVLPAGTPHLRLRVFAVLSALFSALTALPFADQQVSGGSGPSKSEGRPGCAQGL